MDGDGLPVPGFRDVRKFLDVGLNEAAAAGWLPVCPSSAINLQYS
jgi:hypothetical protein